MNMKYHEIDAADNLVETVPMAEWKEINYSEQDFVSQRSGCKVGWRTYSTQEIADECSYAATVNAMLKLEQGFDFGYQLPGNVVKVENGWEVTIP